MKRNTKTTLAALAIAVVSFVGWQFITPKAAEPTKRVESITIGYRAHDVYAPLFVGLEKKIFAKHNLDVKPVKFESTNQLTDALIGGSVNATLGGVNVPLILTIEEKSPNTLKMFSFFKETATQSTSYVLVKKDSPIKTVADLKNKKIGSYTGSTVAMVYRLMVGKYFDPKDATLVQMKPELQVAALESGSVDAIIILEPAATAAMQKGVARTIVVSPFHEYLLNDGPLAASVVRSEYLKTNSATYEKLKAATAEAIEYIHNNPKESRAIINTYSNVNPEVANAIPAPQFIERKEMKAEDLEKLIAVLAQNGELKKPMDAANLLAP